MPVYQYRCETCRGLHEAIQRMSDPPLTTCPACEGPLKRIIAPVGIIFKGSGWHITDYSGDKARETATDKPAVETPAADKPATDKPATDTPKPSSPDVPPASSGGSQKQVA